MAHSLGILLLATGMRPTIGGACQRRKIVSMGADSGSAEHPGDAHLIRWFGCLPSLSQGADAVILIGLNARPMTRRCSMRREAAR